MDNHSENCYFWIDNKIPEDERMMNVMCEQCHDEKHPELEGWYWEGSVKGYGPYDYVCDCCGKLIHKGSNK